MLPANSHGLAHRTGTVEEFIDDGLADHGQTARRLFFLNGEGATFLDDPFANFEIGRIDAGDPRRPVDAAEYRTQSKCADFAGHAANTGDLVADRFGVGICHRRSAALGTAAATEHRGPGADDQKIGPETGYLGLNGLFGSFADRDQHNHRGDTDNHAEHGERGAQGIDPQGGQCDPDRGEQIHVRSSSTWPSRNTIWRRA